MVIIHSLVNNNELTGPIPPELGNLTSMIRFQIDVNRLSGAIPAELGNLTNVNHLYVHHYSSCLLPPATDRKFLYVESAILEWFGWLLSTSMVNSS